MVIVMNFYQFFKMTALSFICFGISLINIISASGNTDRGLTISTSSASGNPMSAQSNIPDYFLFRQQQMPLECTDENCLDDKIDKHIEFGNHFDDMKFGQDYDWIKVQLNSSLYNDEVTQKRSGRVKGAVLLSSSCVCQTRFDLIDLGNKHFPRYLKAAVCLSHSENDISCTYRSQCKGSPFSVRVLTHRPEFESIEDDPLSTLLPEALRSMWKFETFTVSAACRWVNK